LRPFSNFIEHITSRSVHNNNTTKCICLLFITIPSIVISSAGIFSPVASFAKEKVTLNALLVEPRDRWEKVLIPMALQNLTTKYPELDIQVNYTILPYNDAREQMLKAMGNHSIIDVISVDQIWLGEFAEKGLLTDLGNYSKTWGRLDDWYESNLDGAVYNDKIYGIWAWTDVRSIWYWKDLLNKSAVDPNALKLWDSYIGSAKKLNSALNDQGIQ
jgi:multiple sugar transport system substrate-binding protein